MQATANCAVAQQVCIAMSGIAKVYVGEIVEEALRVAVSPSIYIFIFSKNSVSNLRTDSSDLNEELKFCK